MSSQTKLLFVSGSARADSVNKKLARFAERTAQANGVPSAFADLGDYPMPIYDGDIEADTGVPEAAVKLKHLMSVHDGVFIASPEYNAGMTPLLKNAIDWISRVQEGGEPRGTVFKTRVFALGAATPGGLGGVRGLMQLRQTLALGLGAVVLPDQAMVPHAMTAFDDDGALKEEQSIERLKGVIERLARAARLLHGSDT
ncbi:MAG: NAD(P)H-dependent oxidoreductase [Pseudomonadota bacterium]